MALGNRKKEKNHFDLHTVQVVIATADAVGPLALRKT